MEKRGEAAGLRCVQVSRLPRAFGVADHHSLSNLNVHTVSGCTSLAKASLPHQPLTTAMGRSLIALREMPAAWPAGWRGTAARRRERAAAERAGATASAAGAAARTSVHHRGDVLVALGRLLHHQLGGRHSDADPLPLQRVQHLLVAQAAPAAIRAAPPARLGYQARARCAQRAHRGTHRDLARLWARPAPWQVLPNASCMPISVPVST